MTECERTARLLQQFARYPHRGRVKTRLARSLGAEAACRVHLELVEHTARALLEMDLAPVELWLDELAPHALFERLADRGMEGPKQQDGADLGARMHAALGSGLARASRVVLVGSDCPGLDPDYVAAAFTALEQYDLVFGPAEDGGYVLIGARRVAAGLFERMPWGSERVLACALERAGELGLSAALLDPRYDVDEIEDLRRWRASGGGAQAP